MYVCVCVCVCVCVWVISSDNNDGDCCSGSDSSGEAADSSKETAADSEGNEDESAGPRWPDTRPRSLTALGHTSDAGHSQFGTP